MSSSKNDWLVLSKQLHNELNEIKRDALLPYVISIDDDVETPQDVYEKLLIDVEMSGCGTTSKVKEAISAVQLYFHRYFLNLENVGVKNGHSLATQHKLKSWWKWMRNYRVWESNRKVFLYPENYIRPELRDTKTPAFKTLEDDLLQGEITEESAQRAYKKYLDEYTEVSRLSIAGGYVYSQADSSSERNLVLFGKTKTDPRRYYYRLSTFMPDSVRWQPWLTVNVQIDADRVYPVFAFERVFVFWAKVEPRIEDPTNTSITTQQQGNQTKVSSGAQTTYCIKIYYSFYNLNKEWAPPQELTETIKADDPVNDVQLFVENSERLILQGIEADHENIVISCAYKVCKKETTGGVETKRLENRVDAFRLTPELYTQKTNKPGFQGNGAALFSAIFDEPLIELNYALHLISPNKTDKLPEAGEASVIVAKIDDAEDTYYIRVFDRTGNKLIDRERLTLNKLLADELSALFASVQTVLNSKDTQGNPNSHTVSADNPLKQSLIQTISNNLHLQVIMLNSSEKSSDGPWFSFDYKGGSFLCKPDTEALSEDVWPRQINPDFWKALLLPLTGGETEEKDVGPDDWQSVDAAVQIPQEGSTYLFNGQDYAVVEDKAISETKSIRSRWGMVQNNIRTTGIVDAALFDTGSQKTYLFSGNEYLVYSDKLDYADVGHPKSLIDNDDDLPKWERIDAAFIKGNKRYFFNNAKQAYVVSDELNSEKPIKEWGGGSESVGDFFADIANGKPLIDAVFIFNEFIYCINKERFIKYRKNDFKVAVSGYPKKHNFHAILEDLGCINNSDDYKKRRVVSVYDHIDGNNTATIHFTTVDEKGEQPKSYIFRAGRVSTSRNSERWLASFAIGNTTYRFKGNQLFVSLQETPIDLGTGINASFVGTDDQIYLFKNREYIAFPKAGITTNKLVEQIKQWKGRKRIKDNWGHGASNNIAVTGRVDAAFCDGAKIYLFSGDQYFVYSGDERQIDTGYPKQLQQNTEGFPLWKSMGAVLTTADENRRYFFNNAEQTFVASGGFDQPTATAERWGLIRNRFEERGIIDAAYSTDEHLFLISGDQFVRYTLIDGQGPGEFVDVGYPKQWSAASVKQIGAVFQVGERWYVFADDQYAHLESGMEPDAITEFDYIQGNWGNLPYELRSGVDAALTQGKDLYLFKDGQYAQYDNDGGERSKPYEIGDVKYNIIRLTNSTAYKLNQVLFVGGVAKMLSLETQEIDDIPAFQSTDRDVAPKDIATTIRVRADKVNTSKLPRSSHLDFNSANGLYYWEIFFHAPFLIAQALNAGQKFEEAKAWYEYIFDPTDGKEHWQFLPFQPLGDDFEGIIGRAKEQLAALDDESQVDGNTLQNISAIISWLEPLAGALQRDLELSEADEQYLDSLGDLAAVQEDLNGLDISTKLPLVELTRFVEKLSYRYTIRQSKAAQIATYLKDPFDPHAIAMFRHIAYQKAIVMAYVDNLLDWGDMLFRQYSHESINEARMLYVLAHELLGAKPGQAGPMVLSEDQTYNQLFAQDGAPPINRPDQLPLKALKDGDDDYDFLVYPTGTPNDSVFNNPYFFVPPNTAFTEYWNRVADRLYKIRHCLNIEGLSQPLPLFQPPIDPMALVQAASSGAGISAALASANVAVPHYRFSFMLSQAQGLVNKLSQFGGELLNTLEKKEAEELSLLQTRQEGVILAMTRSIKEDQIKEAAFSITSLQKSLEAANEQWNHYDGLLTEGLTTAESAQIGLMIASSALNIGASVANVAGAIAYGFPQVTIGPFSFGTHAGGEQVAESLGKVGEAFETSGEALNMIGEVIGIYAQHERTMQDWKLQKSMAESDQKQIQAQIEGAKLQESIAQRELEIFETEIEHHESITTFMRDKFTNAQLYQWMASQLSGLYYQTYQMAFDMAKAAEKAFQFERGLPESKVSFVNGLYWDSQKKGLLAGEYLGHDLDRMEKAYHDTNRRGFEISKNISLLELDPVALLRLKSNGVCEFALTEELFDYDFPGHYCRQIKTISMTFEAGEGQTVMSTLTQLSHKTVLEADPKAVKYLMEPKGEVPLTIRSNWRANQQIALSYVDQYETNNGLFELRFDDDRYLPFEGTGAVSTWRLELNGKKGSYDVNALSEIVINLKYTAETGGKAFSKAVKGMLKPYLTARHFDIQVDFPEEWNEFLESDSNELILPISRDLFPNMSSSRIHGIYTKTELYKSGAISLTLNEQHEFTLINEKYLLIDNLHINSRDSKWFFEIEGNKDNLRNLNVVIGYQAVAT